MCLHSISVFSAFCFGIFAPLSRFGFLSLFCAACFNFCRIFSVLFGFLFFASLFFVFALPALLFVGFLVFFLAFRLFASLFFVFRTFFVQLVFFMAPSHRRTVNIHIGRKLFGKTRDQILEEILLCFHGLNIVAVQQFPETIRVTFVSEETALAVLKSNGVRLFDFWCRMDFEPPSTIIHLFDFPYEEGEEEIQTLFKSYGTVKAVRFQK